MKLPNYQESGLHQLNEWMANFPHVFNVARLDYQKFWTWGKLINDPEIWTSCQRFSQACCLPGNMEPPEIWTCSQRFSQACCLPGNFMASSWLPRNLQARKQEYHEGGSWKTGLPMTGFLEKWTRRTGLQARICHNMDSLDPKSALPRNCLPLGKKGG